MTIERETPQALAGIFEAKREMNLLFPQSFLGITTGALEEIFTGTPEEIKAKLLTYIREPGATKHIEIYTEHANRAHAARGITRIPGKEFVLAHEQVAWLYEREKRTMLALLMTAFFTNDDMWNMGVENSSFYVLRDSLVAVLYENSEALIEVEKEVDGKSIKEKVREMPRMRTDGINRVIALLERRMNETPYFIETVQLYCKAITQAIEKLGVDVFKVYALQIEEIYEEYTDVGKRKAVSRALAETVDTMESVVSANAYGILRGELAKIRAVDREKAKHIGDALEKMLSKK